MCGATEDQTQIEQSQQNMYNILNQSYATAFGQFSELQSALTSTFMPILQAGPSQTGFSPSEENAMRTQNAEGVATDFAQSQKTAAQEIAARGGGNTLLPSSISANILAGNTNAAAATRATNDLSITNANYQQGYANWQSAANMLSGVTSAWNPNNFGSTATTAGGAASTSANNIATASNSVWNAAIGAVGSIGGAALSPGGAVSKMLSRATTCWIAAELYGGWYEPRTVLIRRWLTENFTGHWLLNLYVRYGERVAAMIRDHRSLRWFFTRVFNGFLQRAREASERRESWQTSQP